MQTLVSRLVTVMGSIVWRTSMLVACAVVLTAGPAHAAKVKFIDPCPADAKKEFAIVPGAVKSIGTCSCDTVVTCTNLDDLTRRTSVSFWVGSSSQGVGASSSDLVPGLTAAVASSLPVPLSPGPVGSVLAAGAFSGFARVCTDARNLACLAEVQCTCPTGPVVRPLPVIRSKQRGD